MGRWVERKKNEWKWRSSKIENTEKDKYKKMKGDLSEFELQPHYEVHFQTNTFEKGMNPLIPLAMGWTV